MAFCCIFSFFWRIFACVSPFILGFILLGYLIPHLYSCLFRDQDLKKKYNAEWALVTGGSSGIGRSVAIKLASQGINVAIVALDDSLLTTTVETLSKQYPNLKFKKIGVDLGKSGYMETIIKETNDVTIQLIFNNAGYMLPGFFEFKSVESQLANMECNATSAVAITHHFTCRLIEKKLPGCVVYTSSAAAAICSPFTALYSGTKAFLSTFGAALAVELKIHNIDVLVIHPSPVRTRFYENDAPKLSVMEFFERRTVPPEKLPPLIFGSLGRSVWRDIGIEAVCIRLFTKVADFNLITFLASRVCDKFPDFKVARDQSKYVQRKRA